ncbi:MAG: hypothetical protein R3345_13105, partial [Fulvivirga sp.]|nr:hypothetical protein [Fulvivirga sp.]
MDALEGQFEHLVSDGPGQAARCWLDHIRLLEEQIDQLEGWLHERLIPEEQIQRLREVPGIGVIGVYTILT